MPRSSARPWRFHSVFSYAFPQCGRSEHPVMSSHWQSHFVKLKLTKESESFIVGVHASILVRFMQFHYLHSRGSSGTTAKQLRGDIRRLCCGMHCGQSPRILYRLVLTPFPREQQTSSRCPGFFWEQFARHVELAAKWPSKTSSPPAAAATSPSSPARRSAV